MKLKISWDTRIGLGIIILGIFILINSFSLPKSPLGLGAGDFPMIISYGLIICGLLLVYQGIKKTEETVKLYSFKDLKKIFLLTLLCFLYVYLVSYIGFLYLTPFLMMATLYLFGYKKWIFGVIISIVFTILVYYVFFSIFKVPLPLPSLF
uniref:Tripartite tricarboxylate transporter TctB family protein n=1 Tax=Dictyoglomus thermophilum TaxID=14 RepID=A0A7C3RUC6_DICTH